ncbi:MAG: Tfp pilus assembly protein PilN [Candidatus Azotimanducaceae bacterium]|jgi:hypothetical protein
MANTPSGSFIPKRNTSKSAQPPSARRIYVFSYISYIFFFGALIAVVGTFFLNEQAIKELNKHVALVAEAQKQISRSELDSVRQLDNRLHAAKQILAAHAAPSVLFGALEDSILRNVQIDSFTYTRTDDTGVTLNVSGLTGTFDAILYQRDVMKENELLASADLVEVSYGEPELREIEGAERDSELAPNASFGEASVTFTFEDVSVLDKIGYTVGTRASTIEPDPVELDDSVLPGTTVGSEGAAITPGDLFGSDDPTEAGSVDDVAAPGNTVE